MHSSWNYRARRAMRPLLIDEGTRYTGDQETLPLSPLWIARQLRESAAFCEGEEITGEAMQTMLARREWREGYRRSVCRRKSCRNRS